VTTLVNPSRSPTPNVLRSNKTIRKVALSLIVPLPLHVPLHNSAKLISHYTCPFPLTQYRVCTMNCGDEGTRYLSDDRSSVPVKGFVILSLSKEATLVVSTFPSVRICTIHTQITFEQIFIKRVILPPILNSVPLVVLTWQPCELLRCGRNFFKAPESICDE
jgi:hypothetical protein